MTEDDGQQSWGASDKNMMLSAAHQIGEVDPNTASFIAEQIERFQTCDSVIQREKRKGWQVYKVRTAHDKLREALKNYAERSHQGYDTKNAAKAFLRAVKLQRLLDDSELSQS